MTTILHGSSKKPGIERTDLVLLCRQQGLVVCTGTRKGMLMLRQIPVTVQKPDTRRGRRRRYIGRMMKVIAGASCRSATEKAFCSHFF